MDEKSFHKWAAQQSQSLSEVLEKLRHNEPQLSTDAQSHLSAIFSVSSPRRTDELAEWCFKMSGFRMSRLDERGEMRSGKSEKHPDNPQSSGFRPSWATKLTRNWRRTQSCCRSRWTDGFFFLFDLFCPLFIDLLFLEEFRLCTGLMQWLFEASGYQAVRGYTVTAWIWNTRSTARVDS